MIGVCGFASAVCWAVANDAKISILNDLDALMPATLYASFVGLGLLITGVLLVYALVGLNKLRGMREATAFQIGTLFKLVLVSGGLVLAFVLSFVFAVLRIRTLPVVAPMWAFVLLGVVVPMCIVLVW
jgi:hypothetical protein